MRLVQEIIGDKSFLSNILNNFGFKDLISDNHGGADGGGEEGGDDGGGGGGGEGGGGGGGSGVGEGVKAFKYLLGYIPNR